MHKPIFYEYAELCDFYNLLLCGATAQNNRKICDVTIYAAHWIFYGADIPATFRRVCRCIEQLLFRKFS